MIKKIIVTNYLGDKLEMELTRPSASGIYIRNITGLGPGQATVNLTEMVSNDGGKFNSARLPSRNIVLTLGFLFDPMIEDVRHKTYRYFPLKRPVTIYVETDRRKGEIVGYVESNEPVIFSKEETTVISVMCPIPYFYSAGEDGTNVTVFSGIEPLFEFPFSNESLTEDLIEMGNILEITEKVIYYTGDADVGIFIEATMRGNVHNLVIANETTGQTMSINSNKVQQLTGSDFIYGDVLKISTLRGEKYLTLTREGIVYNIFPALDRSSDWLTLVQGDNVVHYLAETGTYDIQFRVENKILYYGM